jgi:hypothetical protein
MKKSSMKIAPNGRIPASITATGPFKNHGCVGICLGIWLIDTGYEYASFRNPKNEPVMIRGTEPPNHMIRRMIIVVNGTAPDDCRANARRVRGRSSSAPQFNSMEIHTQRTHSRH